MNIADLISKDRVQAVTELSSKKRTLEELSAALARAAPFLTDADVFASLVSREKLGSTGLGQGVAIPHGRMRALNESVGAFLRLGQGIDFEASDGGPVDLIFGLLVPEDTTEEHLQILAGLAEMFTDDDFCRRLRAADDDEALYELLAAYTLSSADHR